MRPARVAGDEGLGSPATRRSLEGRGIGAIIPAKADEAPDSAFDRAAYRQRNVVARLNNRLKRFLRGATRYEKRAANCRATVMLAAILLWL